MTSASDERARGALLGLAVGDAFGTTNEFKHLDAPPFPELATGPLRAILGGGPFGVAPGQVTDDTQMACCLFASIQDLRQFDAADASRRYLDWRRKAFDVGNQTRRALNALELGVSPDRSGRQVWEAAGDRKPAANGSLMRTAPIGVLLGSDIASRRAASLADSAITHFDPRCEIACAAFNAAIAAAIFGEANAEQMRQVARAEIDELASWDLGLDPASTHAAARDLREDIDMAGRGDPDLYGTLDLVGAAAGFVRVAFRLAFWELLHAPSFEAALIDVVNRGGDADTNGAIAGALCGAMVGEGGIPAEWRRAVLDAPALAGDLRYHPALFLGAAASIAST